MNKYVVSKNTLKDGFHEIHSLEASCPRLPGLEDRQELGEHPSARAALAQAKVDYPKSNGCKFCCLSVYTK